MNETQLPFTTSHAFIIGINEYEHVSRLTTAVNDAKGIAERLEAQHGYEVHGPLLDSTKADLVKLFSETMPSLVQENDRVLFYFAGHGIALDGEDGPNGYLVPADAKQRDRTTLIPMNHLHQVLNDLPCRHGMLILDCCFSGAFKWSTGYRDVVMDLPNIIYEERFWRYCKDPAWQVITSSAYDQKAVDVITNQSIGLREEGSGLHSPFAKALFEAIEGAADVIPADHGDGVITASELYAYMRDSVETQTTEKVKRQSPSMFNLGKHDKGEYIFLNPRHRFNLPPTPDRNPFMGLASYNEADSHFFFGRDRVIEALLAKVETHPLTVVSGASGTGKSSVIKAGLLPILRKRGWELRSVIRPGKEPMKILEEELPDLSETLSEHIKTLLIVDQYEELITQTLHEEEREAFEQQLAVWLTKHPQLRIILSVRSDFEPQFESHSLAPWWKAGRYVVPAFSNEEIREIISKPALQAVLFYEPVDLADRLEEDVAQAPGALPLLSFTLSELYYSYLRSGREDRALTEEDYEALGGVIGALRTRADEVYNSQNENHQNSMRKLMMRMVSLEGGELAGKRVYAEELEFSSETETARIQSVAEQLVEARLILRGKDLQDRVYLEPAHDALVRAWARLWEWIKAIGEEKLIWQNKLSQAVVDYRDLHEKEPQKARNLLWNNNPRLDILKAEIEGKNHGLNAQEEDFVRKSMNRRTSRRRQLIGSLVGAVVIFAGLALWANGQRIAANQASIEAQDSARVAQEQRNIAFLKTQEAEDSARVAKAQREIAILKTKEAQDSAKVAQNQRSIALLKTQEAQDSARVAEIQRKLAEREQKRAEDSAQSAILSRNDALNALNTARSSFQSMNRVMMQTEEMREYFRDFVSNQKEYQEFVSDYLKTNNENLELIISKKLNGKNAKIELYSEVNQYREVTKRFLGDKDFDSVPDLLDKEPDSPPGYIVDARGKTMDSDQDGYPDSIDDEVFSIVGCDTDQKGVMLDLNKNGIADCLESDFEVFLKNSDSNKE